LATFLLSAPMLAALAFQTAGHYTIPRFAHCGFATFLINLTIPGPNNTITLTLGPPKIG
jgi:hypothetical protein